MARPGQTFNFLCDEGQVTRLLREITFNDGSITNKEITAEGVYLTIRKT